jgi:predicted dehydrogenase
MSSTSSTPQSQQQRQTDAQSAVRRERPRLGFVGVGWIGRDRLDAVVRSGVAQVTAIADPSAEMRTAAGASAPRADLVTSMDELLQFPLDGVVIASPSALHAQQALAALDHGLAVFCQKPLGRTAEETAAVVSRAAESNRLLGVDLSYRFAEAFARVRETVVSGEIGQVYAADLVFHNAYGPDKEWFYDPRLAGGGCVMDLGIHLVDMALWVLDFPEVERVSGRLFAGGSPLSNGASSEDYATAQIDLAGGISVRIACSWNLPAGQDAVISASFFGTGGGAVARNVGGSFYDFVAELYRGTHRRIMVEPPDRWGGRAAVDWAKRLASGGGFDPAAREFVRVAETLDLIYRR